MLHLAILLQDCQLYEAGLMLTCKSCCVCVFPLLNAIDRLINWPQPEVYYILDSMRKHRPDNVVTSQAI